VGVYEDAAADGVRNPTWFLTVEGSGTVTPDLVEGETFPFAATQRDGLDIFASHISASGLSGWAAMGVSLTPDVDCHDVSVFYGIGFWARGSGEFELRIRTEGNTPRGEGSCECNCLNGPSLTFTAPSDWQYLEFRWEDFQLADGDPPFELTEVKAFEFQAHGQADFELWVHRPKFGVENDPFRCTSEVPTGTACTSGTNCYYGSLDCTCECGGGCWNCRE
jgi:hypothetical protein